MIQIKSIFERLSSFIFTCSCLSDGQQYIITEINDSGINEKDKLNISKSVMEIKSIYKLQYYVCNALLKYEGLSIN